MKGIRTNREFYLLTLLHGSAWLLVWLLSGSAFYRMMPLIDNILRASINTLLLMSLFYGVGYLYQQFYEHRRYGCFGVGLVMISVLLSGLRYWINMQFSYQLDATSYYQPGGVAFSFGAVLTNLIILLNSLLYHTVQSRIRLKIRTRALQTEQQAAQLQFLRSQMNPHFLFNTLNNIYSLAAVNSVKTAPLVLRLSELLRYVTYDTRAAKVPLAKEIKMLEEYIELFQLQQENPLAIHFDYQFPIAKLLIEPLLLLPIVENCFKHGDFAENPRAYTRLTLGLTAEQLHFSAENTYNSTQQQKDPIGGVGLENIQRRLDLSYAENHGLSIYKTVDTFHVELDLVLVDKIEI